MTELKERPIEPETPEFDHMVFKLEGPMQESNVSAFDYNQDSFIKIQKDGFVMPAFVADEVNLFFVSAPLVSDDWVIMFSYATIEDGDQVTGFADPISTGKGLNQLGKIAPEKANNILDYFNKLIDQGLGEWKLVK